ncbi:MAG: amidohydrolase family protein [Asticcacaulis sp.]
MTDLIDAHLHLWNPEILDYDWLAHVPAIAGTHGADQWAALNIPTQQAVFVQAADNPAQALKEAQWVAAIDHPSLNIGGIVAYAPLEKGSAVAEDIAALKIVAKLRGIRRNVQGEPDGFTSSPAYIDGLTEVARAGLSIDICSRVHQMPELIRTLDILFDRIPEAIVILDHLGKPDIKSRQGDIHADGWATHLKTLSAFPNLSAKISGLSTEADWDQWQADHLTPYIHHAIDSFGPQRCLFGGDWPVVDLSGGYGRWLEVFESATADLSAADRKAIRSDTATRLYRLSAP